MLSLHKLNAQGIYSELERPCYDYGELQRPGHHYSKLERSDYVIEYSL